MGIFDKAKDMAGKAKDKADDTVKTHSEKIPDSVEKTYNKVSDAAEKVIPGSDGDKAADDADAADEG